MISSPNEQEPDNSYSLHPLDASSAPRTDIHREFGIRFPAPPRPMTHFGSHVESLPGSTQNNTVHLLTEDVSAVMVMGNRQPIPAPAGTNQPLQKVTTVSDVNTDASDNNDNWSDDPSTPPGEAALPPSTAPLYNLPEEFFVCIPQDLHDRPFVIPTSIPKDQYAQAYAAAQLCSFASIIEAERFVWTETRRRESISTSSRAIASPRQDVNTGPNQWDPFTSPTSNTQGHSTPSQGHGFPGPPYQWDPRASMPMYGNIHSNTQEVPFHQYSPPSHHGFSTQYQQGPPYQQQGPQFFGHPNFQHPSFSGLNPGFAPGANTVPFYVAKEPPKLKLPKDWDGTTTKWPIFKLKTEMACQELNVTFLTRDLETNLLTAEASKKFAEAIHSVVPHTAMADFLGSKREFYRTRGIEMYQRLRSIHEPTHAGAITSIIDQLSMIRMEPKETASAYKLRVELLNERLPPNVAYTPALLAHAAYKGLDATRYSEFQTNVRTGNKSVNTITELFADIEMFDTMVIESPTSDITSTTKTASARKVTFENQENQAPTLTDANQTYDWKGQKDLSSSQTAFLMKKFYKGCIICRTNSHEVKACPVIKDKLTITVIKRSGNGDANNGRDRSNRSNVTGAARAATADVPDEDDPTNETTADNQGKLHPTSTVSTPKPVELPLSPCTTSEHNLTILFHPSQDNHLVEEEGESEESDQLGSFQQEIFPGPEDPSFTDAMRIRRDTNNASRIAIAQTARVTFDSLLGPCMGRASTVSIDKIVKSGYACVDSGATHDMSNGEVSHFANYRPLPKGSHVLVADNHPIACLGIGTQYKRINGRIIGRRQVLHVPDLKAPLISVRQHRRCQGCSFIADNAGCYLTFPDFSITVDDSTDCLVAYEIIDPQGFDISACDYMQGEPDMVEKLALTETRRFEKERKSRSPGSSTERGYAWQVETRASLRRQQEQASQMVAAEEQANKARDEVYRLEDEAKLAEKQAQTALPEAPMTDDEKIQLMKSLIESFENSESIDYKLLRNIEHRYPRPVAMMPNVASDHSDESKTEVNDATTSVPASTPAPTTPSTLRKHQIPTTTTPADRPDSLPCDKPPSATPAVQRFSDQQLHRYFGFRNLKNWLDLEKTGQETIKIVKGNELPMEIGDVANIKYSRRNTKPIPRPDEYLRTVHMDIGYGDCVSIGGFRYVLLLVDRTTRFQWIYGLKSMTQANIIAALERFHADAGGLPQKIYTDFDPKLIAGDTEKWLLTKIPNAPCRIQAAPSGRQNQNGLVERAWQTTVAMARAYITDMQMPRDYWFWALRHANQVANYIPCKVDGELTTSFELVHGVKPDYRILFRLFSTVYWRVERDGARARDGVAEALSKQGIAIGRDRKSDGLLIYCPHSKQYFVSNSYKIDEGRSTANAFNLKYDGGLFIGLYDNSPASQGVEPYPEGTSVMIDNVRGTVISVPSPAIDRQIPATADESFYVIRLVAQTNVDENNQSTDIIRIAASEMPFILPTPSPWDAPMSTPSWIGKEKRVTYFHAGEYHKGFLEFTDSNAWRFSCRRRNGIEKWGVELPNLTRHFQSFIDDGTLIPGWQRANQFIQGQASHVSASNLRIPKAPGSLKLAFGTNHPDEATWLASYEEEYYGLVDHETFEVISEQTYFDIRNKTGCSAIPSMGLFTVKPDSDGKPQRAKSRIVVLGNKDPVEWTKAECYAPVVSQPMVRLLTALAVRNRTTLKQGDCKNAFCHPELPEDEPTIVRPPSHCPISKPNTYWRLKKTLYGLRRSPRHWFHLIAKQLRDIGLRQTKHDDCLFVGSIIPGRPPLYLGIYVDDLIYFSADPEVEKRFEQEFASRVKVDFMGEADYYLGTHFDWQRDSDGHVTCHLSQEGYANMFVDAMGLQDAVTSPKMTPYRSGLSIDSLSKQNTLSEEARENLRLKYRSYLGMLNWLSISTRPDLTTVHSLLAAATEFPSRAHLDALRHVGRYVKATLDYGISFSSRSNKPLEAFIEFPLQDNDENTPKPTAFADANWGPQDASTPTDGDTRQIGMEETRSICGHLVFLSNGPLIWKSHKEKRNSRSTCEAEVKATDECTKSVQWLRNVLEDLSLLHKDPTPIYNDNMAAVNWSNTTSHKAMRHVNIRESAVREAIHEYNEITVQHIGGKVNPSDLFTKEHKSDEIYRSIRDSFMSRRSSGGC